MPLGLLAASWRKCWKWGILNMLVLIGFLQAQFFIVFQFSRNRFEVVRHSEVLRYF